MDSVKKLEVEPSPQVQKIQNKLKDLHKSQDKKITDSAIRETVEKMHGWIADYATERAPVDKFGGCFDGNQNPAPASRKVAHIAERIKN